MRTSVIVLALVAALVLLTASAWAVTPGPTSENWENWAAYPGPIHQQKSGSGWANDNNNYWNGVNQSDKHADVIQPEYQGNQFLAIYGTSTTSASRNFNESLWTASNLWYCLDYTIQGAFTGTATIYVNQGSTQAAQIEFLTDKKINYRGPVTTLIGYWDGRNADGSANPDLNFLNNWGHICFNLNVPLKTYSLYAGDPSDGSMTTVFTNKAFRNAVTQVDHVQFLGGKTGNNDWDYGYTGVDNIHLLLSDTNPCVPEPSSLLALATGLIGLGGLVIRRKR